MISQTGVKLQDMCSYKIGGRADIVHFPESLRELQGLIAWHVEKKRPYWIHGRGCNTIFADAGTRLPIIATGKLNGFRITGSRVRAQAGVVLDKLIGATLAAGLGGLEQLSGIPGSIGGAVHMNAGAYGTEISRHLSTVTVLSPQGKIEKKNARECDFSYRHCGRLQHSIILEAEWELEPENQTGLLEQRKTILRRRAMAQPLHLPSAGSVFKRPPGDYASRLMDAAGLKGTRVGDAQVAEKHAGFIVNTGQATSQDLFALIAACQQRVKTMFGIELELEQQVCPVNTPDSTDQPAMMRKN